MENHHFQWGFINDFYGHFPVRFVYVYQRLILKLILVPPVIIHFRMGFLKSAWNKPSNARLGSPMTMQTLRFTDSSAPFPDPNGIFLYWQQRSVAKFAESLLPTCHGEKYPKYVNKKESTLWIWIEIECKLKYGYWLYMQIELYQSIMIIFTLNWNIETWLRLASG